MLLEWIFEHSKKSKVDKGKSAGERFFEDIRENADFIKTFFNLPQGYIVGYDDKPADDCVKLYFEGSNEKYKVELDYGIFIGINALYLNDISRVTDIHSNERVGSKILDGIASMASAYGFKYVGLNPVAAPRIIKDGLEQEELEEWYKRHLNHSDFDLVFGDNSKLHEFINEKQER